ncbi:MAG: hypothetical protein WA932_09985, partial [Nitrososphaeraceae archaeon]
LILPRFSEMKIRPSFEISIDLGARSPSAIISTPLVFVKLLRLDTGAGNGTKVSEGENFMVKMLTMMTSAEGITSLISCLLSIGSIRFDFL